MERVPIVGIVGGGDVSDKVAKQARQVGRRVAEKGWVLLNGGRDAGVMQAATEGAASMEGTVIGVLPWDDTDQKGAASGLTHRIATGMGEARNVVNVLSSDVIVACRGGAGTLSEVAFAVKAGTPVILLDWPDGEVPDQLEDAVVRVGSPREAVDEVEDLVRG